MPEQQDDFDPSNGLHWPRSLILIDPPRPWLLEGFSSGLIALANYCQSALPDCPVQILDLGSANDAEATRLIRECAGRAHGQLFVGITTTTASYQAALQVAKTFKLIDVSCITILGGSHATAQDDVVLKNHTTIDFVVRGEGEVGLVALLQSYPEVACVPNLTYRTEPRLVARNALAPLLDQAALDQSSATFLGWGLKSAPGKFDHITYVSARGCPLKCSFCAVANERIRNKSIDAVINDLRTIIGTLGYSSIAMEDNFFAHSPRRTIELCRELELLQRDMSFRWDCQTRVESCQNAEVMESMERAGCDAVYIGVESVDEEQLLYLNKTRQPKSYLAALAETVVPWLLQSTISCYINLQLSLPGETERQRSNSIRFLKGLGEQAVAHSKVITIFPMLHVIYPGTAHFFQAVDEGRFGSDGESIFERFTSWESRQQPILRWLGEHFAHGTGGIPYGILFPDRLSRGEFEIDPLAVVEVINYWNSMAQLPGIKVYRYGQHLAGSAVNHSTAATECDSFD